MKITTLLSNRMSKNLCGKKSCFDETGQKLFLSQFQSNKISQKQNTGNLAQVPVRKRKIEFVSVWVVC